MINSNKKTRGDLGREEFNLFHNVILALKMRFSDKPNSSYDASSATILLANMCRDGLCAEQASEILNASGIKAPGSDWLLGKLGDKEYDDMYSNVKNALRKTIRHASNAGIDLQNTLVAIDKTKIDRYDKNPCMKYLIKHKGGKTQTLQRHT